MRQRQHGLLLTILIAVAVMTCGAATETLAAGTNEAASYSVNDAEKYIMDSEAAWDAASVAGDKSVPQRILADDYIGVFPDGRIVNKSEALAVFKPGEIVSAHLDYAHVRFFGNTAVVQGQDSYVMRNSKGARFIFTDVFVLRNGKWQLVNSEDQYHPIAK